MREVRSVEQYTIGTYVVDGPFHLIWVGRSVERLDGEPEMVAHDLGRRAVDPGHLGAHPAPELRKPPQEAGKPGHARFEQHHLEPGIFGEHALADEARHLRLE